MVTRVLLTFLIGLVVSLGTLVSGGSGVAWAGNWNLSPEQQRKFDLKKLAENTSSLSRYQICSNAVDGERRVFSSDPIRKPFVDEARRRNDKCGVDPITLSDNEIICNKATRDGFWDEKPQYADYVKEAKRRGLSCGVNTFSNISDDGLCNKATRNGDWDTAKQYQPYVKVAKFRGLDCGVTVTGGAKTALIEEQNSTDLEILISSMSQPVLCRYAVKGASWETDLKYQKYVQEAKRRGLSCGVGETTQTASVQVPKAKPKVTSAALTAAEKEAERLRQRVAALEAEKAKQQQTISNDTKLPTITIASAASNGPQGTVKGRVKDNTGIAEVRVDGKQIQTDKYGNFIANTYVPEGGVSVSIQAIDLAGLSSSMSVRIDRAAVQTAAFRFDRLNPLGRKVARNKDAVAIIVGVSDYKETTARAAYADSDAKVFKDYAIEKLGVPRDRIKTLVNDGADEKDMLLAVKRWLARASKRGKTDVYIFFAGHGLASDDGQKMYLLPYDGAPELLDDTAILRDRLFSDIASANPRSVTVFLDTCYSGTTRGTDMLIASRPIAIKALEQSIPDNFTVMTAARGDQTAKPLEEAKHGLFSYFLMKGMEGEADQNQDNKITAGELHSYVQQNVVQQSSGSQTPELQGDAERVLVRFQ